MALHCADCGAQVSCSQAPLWVTHLQEYSCCSVTAIFIETQKNKVLIIKAPLWNRFKRKWCEFPLCILEVLLPGIDN